jgi:hypothetical protein
MIKCLGLELQDSEKNFFVRHRDNISLIKIGFANQEKNESIFYQVDT